MNKQILTSKRRSQAFQEFFAFSVGGPNKTYIEIGAFKPVSKSNTYVLEVDQGWRGFSMELNQKYKAHWDECQDRNNPVCWENAITFDYRAQLDRMGLPPQVCFLSCDIEPPSNTFAALKQVIEQGVEFDCICFEHDKANPSNKDTTDYDLIVREYLASKGYRVAVSGVYCKTPNYLFETWFVKNNIDYPPEQTFDQWKAWLGVQ